MATGTGSLKELREKRKMELASTEYVNSNKILQGEETSIHSIFYIENVSALRAPFYQEIHKKNS